MDKANMPTIAVEPDLYNRIEQVALEHQANVDEILSQAIRRYLWELDRRMSDSGIHSHWGEWRVVQLFVVDLELDELRLPDIFVVGDEQGDEIILGRNILNKLRMVLDGPANITDVRPQ